MSSGNKVFIITGPRDRGTAHHRVTWKSTRASEGSVQEQGLKGWGQVYPDVHLISTGKERQGRTSSLVWSGLNNFRGL